MKSVPPVLKEPARPRPWHVLSATEALEQLGTSSRGLTDEEARVRLDRHRLTTAWQENVETARRRLREAVEHRYPG